MLARVVRSPDWCAESRRVTPEHQKAVMPNSVHRTCDTRAKVIWLLAFIATASLDAQPARVTEPIATTASLRGIVYDSLAARVLTGATVELVRQGTPSATTTTVVSDSMGRFRFTKVEPGRFLLRFLHPVLDRLGVEPSPQEIVVSRRAALQSNLAVPSAATLRLELCGDDALRDSVALIIGFARRARDRVAMDSVIVTAIWQPRAPKSTAPKEQLRQRRVAAASSGWFVICAARNGDAIQLAARRKAMSADLLSLVIPPSGVLQSDVLLGDGPAAAGARSSVVASSVSGNDPPIGEQAPPGVFRVSGVVVTADGARPIPGAIVSMPGAAVTRSDAQGVWSLAGVRGGMQTVTVRAVRYTPLSATVSVSGQTRPVRLMMVLLPATLDTVNVVEDAEADRILANFLERRRTRGSGTFLTDEDIASRRPTLTSDVFRSIQGGVTIERDSLGNRYLAMPSNTFRSARCLPAIFIDGMSMRGLTTADIDGLLQPIHLLGIEVYRAANAPAEFSEQDGCGTILLWTKK